jgi:hypothetical protein
MSLSARASSATSTGRSPEVNLRSRRAAVTPSASRPIRRSGASPLRAAIQPSRPVASTAIATNVHSVRRNACM